MNGKNILTFNERCKQIIKQARAVSPTDQAVIGHLATRLVITQNAAALNIQRIQRLLQEMEEETWRQK